MIDTKVYNIVNLSHDQRQNGHKQFNLYLMTVFNRFYLM